MATKRKRAAGRPRAKSNAGAEPARQAILRAAAGLFGDQGYAATSTRQIADRVGIRQPSLFYHFGRKEAILQALIDEVASDWQVFLAALRSHPSRGATQVCTLLMLDLEYLMTEEFGIGRLIALPEIRSGDFQRDVERARSRIVVAYRDGIEAGVADGTFRDVSKGIAAHTLIGICESVWAWYPTEKAAPVRTVIDEIADLAMRGLLRNSRALTGVKKAALACLADLREDAQVSSRIAGRLIDVQRTD